MCILLVALIIFAANKYYAEMKKQTFYVLGLIVFCIMVACTKSRVHRMIARNNGNLYIEDSILSFGKISKSKEKMISCIITLKNIGTSPVTIVDGRVSCGCMSVKIPAEPIRSNEIVDIPVVIHTENLLGAFNKSVVLYTDREMVNKIIRIKGEICK